MIFSMLLACGLNYKSPLKVRETVAYAFQCAIPQLSEALSWPIFNEVMVLSTCNRTEIYCETDKPDEVIPYLLNETPFGEGLSAELKANASAHFYVYQEYDAVRHALRVGSGLDSMMLGEPQILGQLKQAYHIALTEGLIHSRLQSVFQYVFNASKRIRNQSGIGNKSISIAYGAVQLLAKGLSDFSSLTVFLIGSGETAALLAKYLQKRGVTRFMIASRSIENAKALAQVFKGQAFSISDIPHHLAEADVVISATACPLPFISSTWVSSALEKRNGKPMRFVDLSMPRDIEPEVANLPNVLLYNLDDLEYLSEEGKKERQAAAEQADILVDLAVEHYILQHRSSRANTIISHYRSQMKTLAEQELTRARGKLRLGCNEEQVLEEFCNRLVKKLVHYPTIGLRQAAQREKGELIDFAKYLYSSSQEAIPL